MLGGIAEALGGLWGRRDVGKLAPPTAADGTGSDSGRPHSNPGSTKSESVRRPPRLQYRSVEEHAERLLEWIWINIDIDAFGLVLHQDMLIWYSEMCIEGGWMERSWNPVGRAFDILTTGGAKPYCWVFTKNGKKVRRRHYPVRQAGIAQNAAPVANERRAA